MVYKLICWILISVIAWYSMSLNVSAVSVSGISAKAYILIEAQTGTVIASRNEHEMLPMASTTKIMTTLLLLESGELDKEFSVDNDAIMVEGSSMGLCEDDIVTKLALCYGMMLPSGNDAANQTAVLLAGNIEKFAEMMNMRASEIGLKNTNFVTPSGLHHNSHYSTAYDMAMLTREALKNKLFKEICGTQHATVKFGNPPYERCLVNTNKLLHMYDYCIGVKTGFTDEAGRCLVSTAEKDGVSLICVTLNAPDDWNDHIELYDYGFSITEMKPIDYDYSKLLISVAGGKKEVLSVLPEIKPMCAVINGKCKELSSEVLLEKFLYAPVSAGQSVGKINFYLENKLVFSTKLIANENCEAVVCKYEPSIFEKIVNYIKRLI